MSITGLRIAAGAVIVAVIAAMAFLLRPVGDAAVGEVVRPARTGSPLTNVITNVDGFERPSGQWTLALPHDHAPHPDARAEVWQLSAHLADGAGAPVGVQFSVLRVGIVAPNAPEATSTWDTREIYRAHVAFLDSTRRRSIAEERFGRGMAGVAGFDAAIRELRLDHWALSFGDAEQGQPWRLRVAVGDATIDVTLAPEKSPLLLDAEHTPVRGYAISRMKVEGVLETDAGRVAVAGAAWFDHLWGELPILGGSPVTSDSLQLQLDDGAEVSVLRSRRVDGGGSATVEALLIDPQGVAVAVSGDAAKVNLTRLWRGSTAAGWPLDWSVRVGDLAVSVTPVLDNQEHDFATPLWSGLVRAAGQHGGRPVTGTGTLQLTGPVQP
jgi:predicted secreted hydrolase